MITTERMILRPWTEEDFGPYAELNADPVVREFFPRLLTKGESDAEASRLLRNLELVGFGLYAAELTSDRSFMGFIGIQTMNFTPPGFNEPPVEIGWRLAQKYWGSGLATEGARAVLDYALHILELPRVVAITVPANGRSRRVIEKIGMTLRSESGFDHPGVPDGHPLRPHLLYAAER
jgi:RimJ/RimL family protein N-acetyltransferase